MKNATLLSALSLSLTSSAAFAVPPVRLAVEVVGQRSCVINALQTVVKSGSTVVRRSQTRYTRDVRSGAEAMYAAEYLPNDLERLEAPTDRPDGWTVAYDRRGDEHVIFEQKDGVIRQLKIMDQPIVEFIDRNCR